MDMLFAHFSHQYLPDLNDYAKTYRATRDTYLKQANACASPHFLILSKQFFVVGVGANTCANCFLLGLGLISHKFVLLTSLQIEACHWPLQGCP